MIPHSLPDLAQRTADALPQPRQEVTVQWYLDNIIDECLWRWTSDDDAAMGLDPWRYHMDLPLDPEEIEARGWRIFVVAAHPAVEAELLRIADENYRAKVAS